MKNHQFRRRKIKDLPYSLLEQFWKTKNRFEIQFNIIRPIYYDKVDILELLFPEEDWSFILNCCGKGNLNEGSKYDLNVILGNYFTHAKLEIKDKKVNIPSRLATNLRIVEIINIFELTNDKYYDYVHAEDTLFKINKNQTKNIDYGALEIGIIPSGCYIDLLHLRKEQGGKEWFSKYEEVIQPVSYVMRFLSKTELENHKREVAFFESD